MNPEDKKILQETYELSKENNKILRGIRRSNRWSTIFRAVYWVVIIGASVAALNFLQPYLTALTKAYTGIQSDLSTVKSVTSKLPTLGK